MNKVESRINLFNCPIDALSMDQTLDRIASEIENKGHMHHAFVNAATVVNLQKDSSLKNGIIHCDLISADGFGVILAAKLLGKSLPERVSGPDLMEKIVKLANENGYKIYFLGAEQAVVEKVVKKYAEIYSPKIIAGFRNGYFTEDGAPLIAKQIADTNPNILFVAITSPKKEKFLYENKKILSNINFITGVGGCFDLVAGKTKRAPLWMQKVGLEWFYRLIQEPRRLFMRYLTTNFLLFKLIIKTRFNNN